MVENKNIDCPYCGEEIKAEAIKCKHCYTMLTADDSAAIKNASRASVIKAPIWQQWWLWAAGVVLLLLWVIVLLAGSSPNNQSTTPNPSTPNVTADSNPQENTPEPDHDLNLIGIGDMTSFADWTYKVIDVEYHGTIQDNRARGVYVVFMIEITNNANVPRDVGYLFQLEDDGGRVFAFDSSVSLAHHQTYRTDTWHLEDIGPSFTAGMAIAFDIANDADTLFLYPRDIRDDDFMQTSIIMTSREN